MILARRSQIRGQVIVLLVIVLAILGCGFWYLQSSRKTAEEQAHAFAAQVAEALAVKYDVKFLKPRLSPEAQIAYLPSWRDRLIDRLREFGAPSQPIPLDGKVEFTSQFFDPKGTFRAHLNYPKRAAYLDIVVSRGMAQWQIDTLNLTWNPDPKEQAY